MPHLDRAYALKSVTEARDLYDEWAASYNEEMNTQGREYMAPLLASQHLAKILGSGEIDGCSILDAGCGTGMVGEHLRRLGAKNIDGIDISTGMLDVARKTGAYNLLSVADLSKPLAMGDGAYKGVICVGTLTQGHVGPEVLNEFVRVTEAGGFIVATVLSTVWGSGGYEQKVKSIVDGGRAALISAGLEDIVHGGATQVRMVILRTL